LLLHHYAVIQYQTGRRYEMNSTRRMGITEAEVSDILALAWLHACNPAINEFPIRPRGERVTTCIRALRAPGVAAGDNSSAISRLLGLLI